MPRSLREDAPDAVFHVTARVNWRYWHLQPEFCATTFLTVLDGTLREFDMDVFGFVLMSNHFHAVPVSPGRDRFRELTARRTSCRHSRPWPPGHLKSSVLSQCFHKLMYRVSRAIQARLKLEGRFWDGRYHARRLTDEADLVIALAYDHLNPVRANLAERPEDYPRSSAAWWAGGSSSIELVRGPLPFGLELGDLRRRLLRYQGNKDVMRMMQEVVDAGVGVDSPEGRARLEDLLRATGL